MSIRFQKIEHTVPFLAEFAVKDDHRHALGLADEIIDASLKFQGGKIV